MKINISTYWKCQLIGWSLFAIVADAFAVLNEPFDYIRSVVLLVSIKIILLGILLSHLMKMLIQKLHVLQRPLSRQIFYFFLITGLISVLFIVIFNIIAFPNGVEFVSGVVKLNAHYLTIFLFFREYFILAPF